MYLKEIAISNFRNYTGDTRLEFSSGNNIFLGENAQGKSNLLEAIYYLALAHSFRGARDNDLIKFDENFFRVEGKISKEDREQTISISYSKDKAKQYMVDDVQGKTLSDIIGKFNCVVFSPEHLQLVRGAPSLRRKYLDTQISQVVPSFYQNMREYKRIVRQRNEVLKSGQEGQLAVWDQILCKAGAKIVFVRLRALKKLSKMVTETFMRISGETLEFQVSYLSTLGELEYIPDEKSIYVMYMEKLLQKRDFEFRTCATVVGPHRDDINLILDGSPLKDFGSQGQQRMAVLSLKMGELNFIKEFTGEYPVLLLDDVMSELDSKRRKYVVDNLEKVQTFITATDRSHFNPEFIEGAAVKNIVRGKIH